MSEEFIKTFDVRWADIDMNRHMRHTAYGDYAAHVRTAFLAEKGFPLEKLYEFGIGPALIREEISYFREIGANQKITVNLKLAGLSKDGALWKFLHEFHRGDNKLSAAILATGVWIDFKLRKKTLPPKEMFDIIQSLPKTQDFEILVASPRPAKSS